MDSTYNLNENSIVFDLGGYKGDFAAKAYEDHKCNVYVFEPVKSFYERIRNKFQGNNKIKVLNYGILNEDT